MSRRQVVTEVAAFAVCLAVFVGSWVVFGDGAPRPSWIVVFVVAYLVFAGVRIAWQCRRRSGPPPT